MFSRGNVFFCVSEKKNGRTAVSAVCESASTGSEKLCALARFFLMGAVPFGFFKIFSESVFRQGKMKGKYG